MPPLASIPGSAWLSRSTVAHARSLLGKYLVRRHDDGRVESQMITEVEAYDGPRDLACHASKGRTGRTEVMFAGAGVWYVYLCYGIHEMLNLVTGPPDYPAAVLIRGLHRVNGPGRLTRALDITRALNGTAAAETGALWVAESGLAVPRSVISATPRIGVDYAGPVWAGKPWRFVLDAAFWKKICNGLTNPTEIIPAGIASVSTVKLT
jgi:DNA-3-methyladenine glycosylase